VDTLALNANGTYTETYRAKSGRVDRQEGAWTLEELQAGSTVVLDNFSSPSARGGQRGFYLLLVKRSFGSMYLITDIDLGEGYKRQR
jgi:hypothetical protein